MARDLLRRLRRIQTLEELRSLFEEIKQRRNNFKAAEAERLLIHAGFRKREGAKHAIWIGHEGVMMVLPRSHQTLKGPYVDKILKLFEELAEKKPELFIHPLDQDSPAGTNYN